MATWDEFALDAPELAAATRARFESTKHHVLATLRRDGSPRVSGTEVAFNGPDLTLGSMFGAVKARDLQRDGRYAIHANPGDGSMEGGDAKVAGVAVEVVDGPRFAEWMGDVNPPLPAHLFLLGIDEVVLTSLHPDGDRLVVQTWRPDKGVTSVDRY